jgi:hypothetical protein
MDLDWIVDVLVVWICHKGLKNQQIRILQIFSKTLLDFTQEKHEAVVASDRRKRARNWSSHNNENSKTF